MNINKIKIKNCNLDLSENILGKRLIIDNHSERIIDDEIFFDIVKLERIDFKSFSNEYANLIKTLNVENFKDIGSLVGKEKVKKHCKLFLEDFSERKISNYYFDVLKKRKILTEMIKESNYDHVSSITGRASIKNGFNYLTQKKQERSNIEIKKGHSLVEVDIKSCEPSFLNTVLYGTNIKDIYSEFGKDSNCDRIKKKIAIISTLYGGSKKKIANNSGMNISDVQKIFEYFQVENITKKIIQEHDNKGYFTNFYGRKIYEISSPLNYWLQSSSADYCHLAFLHLVKSTGCNLKAVIHDAVLLEVPNDILDNFKKIKYVYDPMSKIKLHVDIIVISQYI